MVLLGPAIAFAVAHGIEKGFAPFEKTLLATVWLVPFVARLTAKLGHIPVGALMMLALFAFIIFRAAHAPRQVEVTGFASLGNSA